MRTLYVGKLLLQRLNDVTRLIKAQSSLREVSDPIGVGHSQHLDLSWTAHNLSYIWSFTEGSDDFIVIAMSHEDERMAFFGKIDGLNVDLSNKGTGRIDYPKTTRLAGRPDLMRNSMGAIDYPVSMWDFFDAIYENRPFRCEFVDYVPVMDNFFPNVNRGSK